MIASGTRPQARPFLDQISLPTPANVAARGSCRNGLGRRIGRVGHHIG
jgi:hypothetical protein